MESFTELGNRCETAFSENGPYWHLYTSGKETPVIFSCDDDFRFAMNLICQAMVATPGVVIIGFELMSNHLHVVAAGALEQVYAFFEFIRRRLVRWYSSLGRGAFPAGVAPTVKAVADLRALRNLIVYVHRNGYVANHAYTPMSYPWGTGRFYFNDFPAVMRFGDLRTLQKRDFFKGRVPELPDDYLVYDGYVLPSSFCSVGLGMSMFQDTHQYFSILTRNVEAYSELALEIGDSNFLTDNELVNVVRRYCQEKFGASLREISQSRKLELAKMLHYEFRASNEQLRRVVGLSRDTVDSMFPLSSKTQP